METYRQALVCGLGGSGEAAAALLRAEGTDVSVIDRASTDDLRARAAALEQQGVKVLLGAGTLPGGPFDVCVASPGVPPSSPWLAEARERGLRVVSELELGWSRCRARTAAITGSNGKSTAVKLLAESLRLAGLKAEPGGNYGPAICRLALEHKDLDWVVLEVSTFQLETVDRFRPDVGILLNIHPNHLDRHGDMATYTRLKARLFARTRPGDICLVHEPVLAETRSLSGGKGRWSSFGVSAGSDYRYERGWVWRGGKALADFRGTHFGNEVLGLAAAAVVGGLEACGAGPDGAVRAARTFKPLPHRMEPLGEIRGVSYVNDSKATNLSALAAALRMTPGRVRLIAGGLVKEKDFSFVKEMLAQRVQGVYLIGQASEEMASAWSDVVPCFRCQTLDAAVRKAGSDALAGETVLLSPACASFDQFRNFEERGQRFAGLVKDLAEEEAK